MKDILIKRKDYYIAKLKSISNSKIKLENKLAMLELALGKVDHERR